MQTTVIAKPAALQYIFPHIHKCHCSCHSFSAIRLDILIDLLLFTKSNKNVRTYILDHHLQLYGQ